MSTSRLMPPQRRLAEWLSLAAVLLCGALISVYFAWSEQERAEASEAARMGAQARIVDDNLRRQFAGLRSALDSVRASATALAPGCRAGCVDIELSVLRRALPGVRALLVVDRDGKVLERDDGDDARQVDFRAASRSLAGMRDPERVYLDLPAQAMPEIFDVRLAMPLPASVGGAVVAVLSPDYFDTIMHSVLYAPDMHCVLTEEGGRRILFVPRLTKTSFLASVSSNSFFSRHIHGGKLTTVMQGRSLDSHDERMIVQRSVLPAVTGLDRTLVVGISRNHAELLRTSQRLSYAYAIAWLVLALASVAVLLMVQRRRSALQEWAEQRQAERAADAERIEMALDGAGLGLWECEVPGKRVMLDARGAAMLGYTVEQANSDPDFMQGVHPDDRTQVEQCFARHLTGQLTAFEVEYRQRHANGSWVWIHSRGKVVKRGPDGYPRRLGGTRQDISARKQAEAKIEHLAFYDTLTSLPNRRLLQDRVTRALVKSERHRRSGAILFIDLDNFKNLNDTLGHDMGDRLQQQVALRLTAVTRDADSVARLGGDEFIILLEDLDNFGGTPGERAGLVADKVLTSVSAAYFIEGHEVHITPSVGITLFDGQARSTEELLKQADLAMYDAKSAGRNTFRFFAPILQVSLDEQARLENDLREAVRRQELLLYFQPIVDEAGNTICAEALVRWRHPERGLLGPAEFIPVAEKSGLILGIGQWVMEQACDQLASWSLAGHALRVAVNVSARQFRQDDFVDQVLHALRRNRVDPRHLKLELTESILLHDVDEVIAKMAVLKAHGICFALDDFGTGCSSLSYLQRLPFDQLKIDKSFVHDMLGSQNAATIVCAIIGLAASLGMDVVAEGVESEQQREFLATSGCDQYQGYLIGKPMTAEQLALRWLPELDSRPQ
ncbi:putative bifunctional diguanylate cyclase/phosphodiesterase [Massilia aerilata]|uniref:Bifunctional diguanylate cyclase/phosphodiesterase n=1 Tax=Massilia aerilata TaxID=453817 RepID=A0ABW0S0P7_9BURK